MDERGGSRRRGRGACQGLQRPLLGKTWVLTRYEDVVNAFNDPRFAHNRRTVTNEPSALDRWYVPKLIKAFQSNMLASDPPDHRRLRTLVQKAFTPGRVEEIRDAVVRVVTELLDAAAKKERVDLIADFALPLPLTIISMMMGVPEEDRFKFHHWTAQLLDASTASPLKMLGQFANAYKLQHFFRKLIQMRREQPSDGLLTALVQAEEQGDRLSEDELVSMIFLILLAGHETTVNLIGNGVLALLQHPDQLEKLRADPDLIVPGIEELLRFGNAVEQSAVHFAKEDITLHGELIPRGDHPARPEVAARAPRLSALLETTARPRGCVREPGRGSARGRRPLRLHRQHELDDLRWAAAMATAWLRGSAPRVDRPVGQQVVLEALAHQVPPGLEDLLGQGVLALETQPGVLDDPMDVSDHFIDHPQDADHVRNARGEINHGTVHVGGGARPLDSGGQDDPKNRVGLRDPGHRPGVRNQLPRERDVLSEVGRPLLEDDRRLGDPVCLRSLQEDLGFRPAPQMPCPIAGVPADQQLLRQPALEKFAGVVTHPKIV